MVTPIAAYAAILAWRDYGVSRDYLDENGGGQSEFEAAAGSEVMIGLSPEVRKHFFWVSVFDCR
jgi:hypothetical protein